LSVVLSNPPLNTKNQVVKDAAFQLVLRVLKSIQNGSEIEKAVRQLDINAVDVLMKYIYKGFEKESNNSSILLNWHEKVCSEFHELI
jgi:actin related protein 2/3 complex subunit 5